jgi:hypothetical protein
MSSNAGLLGEIDYEKTKNGNIVCKACHIIAPSWPDGFTATTVSPNQFKVLTSSINNISVKIEEVDSPIRYT